MGRLKKARFLCRLSEEKSTVLLNLAECSFSKNRTNSVPWTNYVVIVRLNLDKAKFMSIDVTLFPFLYPPQAGMQQRTDLMFIVFLRPLL